MIKKIPTLRLYLRHNAVSSTGPGLRQVQKGCRLNHLMGSLLHTPLDNWIFKVNTDT